MTVSEFRPELQSVRGLAAICVALSHCITAVSFDQNSHAMVDALLNAHAAVILFFVLSGYVLTQSMQRSGVSFSGTLSFYIRRLFRIYPALWLTVAFACAIMIYGVTRPTLPISDWYAPYFEVNFLEARQLNPVTVATNMVPLSFWMIPPTWSIFVELVGSLLIPVFVYIMRKSIRYALVVLAVLTVPVILWRYVLDLYASFTLLLYTVQFAFGVFIALWNPLAKLSSKKLVAIGSAALAGLIFYRAFANYLDAGQLMPITYRYSYPISGLVEGLFAAAFIAAIATLPSVPFLRRKSLIYIGDISYGLYLIHFPMLGLVVGVLSPMMGLQGIEGAFAAIGLTLALTFAASAAMFHVVEKPFIRLGKHVSNRLFHRSYLRAAAS